MYSPPGVVVPRMVSTMGPWGCIPRVLTGAAGSVSFESTNGIAYLPVLIPATCVARRLWWANGSTVSASYNIDCGIYADAGYKPGAKLISTGSTAQGTASQVQFVDITDTTLAPGLYWLALQSSSSSATFFAAQGSASYDALARFAQATAGLPLPSTATPAEAASTYFYACGFATTASP